MMDSENENGLRLSDDEWIVRRFGDVILLDEDEEESEEIRHSLKEAIALLQKCPEDL